MKTGPYYLGNGTCKFTVWAPLANQVALYLLHPEEREIPMVKQNRGYFSVECSGILPGAQYLYRIDGNEKFPDPASNFQIKDVHGPSVVVDHSSFQWTDKKWKGIKPEDMIIYELHIGTFTPEGTFDSIIERLDDLAELGINAIEIMPVSQFSGDRNWGYDGVYIYSVHNTYGKPDQFKKFIDACHAKKISVILDVVYNHLGPEGNYLSKFGPYFTNKYCTPWGDALNFDGEYADGVRDFFSDNALFWFQNYHIDGLRLDATHMVFDNSAIHFWEYVSQKVQSYSLEKRRAFYLIGENDTNGLKHIKSLEEGGFGFTSAWLDDFHHALYVLLDDKGKEYYGDFGEKNQLIKAIKEGYVHSGEYVEFRKRKHGVSSAQVKGEKFVVFSQNHDQIGNRMLGERNSVLMSSEALKLAAAIILLSPYIPLLFMGEEYAEDNPFLYFISHLDDDLVEKVREGRKKDFDHFNFEGNPPDPQSDDTFYKSKLDWRKKDRGKHKEIWLWYKELINIRKTYSCFKNFDKTSIEVLNQKDNVISLKRRGTQEEVLCLFNISQEKVEWDLENFKNWQNILDSGIKDKDNHILNGWGVKVFVKNL